LFKINFLTGSWFRNGVKLSRSESTAIRTDGKTHTLVMKNLTADDNNAEFSFSADGCQSSAVLTVKGKLLTFCFLYFLKKDSFKINFSNQSLV